MAAGGVVTGAGAGAGLVRHGSVGLAVLARAIASQVRIIGLLIFREGRTQFAESPFKTIFEIIEPLIFIVGFYYLHTFLVKGTDFGTSMLLFYATGFTPYWIFLSISSGVKGSARDIRSLRNFPLVTPLDLIISRSVFETLIACPLYFGLFFGMWVYGIPEAVPSSVENVISCIFMLCLFGFGLGMINACISTYIPQWMTIWKLTGRLGMITSGVHRIPEYLPEYFRQYVVWNPIMHGVEWFRSSFYLLYPTYSLDIGYLISWAVATFVFGLAFERVVRARLYRSKKERK